MSAALRRSWGQVRRCARLSLFIAATVCLVWVSLGCTPTTYCIRRSALVPVPSPSMRPARVATGHFEMGVSNDTVLYARPPEKKADRNVGLYVPRVQLGGYLLGSPKPMISLGVSWEAGLSDGAIPISKGLIPAPDVSLGGAGFHFGLHFKPCEVLTLDMSMEFMGYYIPSRISYRTCDGSASSWSDKKIKGSFQYMFRARLALGLDLGWSHLTFGGGIRNQVHNVDSSMEEHLSSEGIEPRLSHAGYPYVQVTWEVHIQEWLHVSAGVYQPLAFDPVIYAPIVAISLRFNTISEHFPFRPDLRRGRPQPPPPEDHPDELELLFDFR